MIQIITENVKMPNYKSRRFQINPKDCNGKKWNITDTNQNRIVGTRNFEDATLICHNLNKKYYKEQFVSTK